MQNSTKASFFFLFLFFSVVSQLHGQAGMIVTSSEIYEGRADIVARQCVILEPGFHAKRGSMIHAFIDDVSVPPNNDYHPTTGGIDTINAIPNTDKNYIMTTTMREATSDEGLIDQTARMVEIEYLNDFGEPEMTVLVKGSPEYKNLVGNIVKYDIGGRKARDYLPYESQDSEGVWEDAPTESYYYHLRGWLEGRDADSLPWEQHIFDGSPLNRLTSNKGVGMNWRGHSTQIKYKCNSSAITHWKYDSSDNLEVVSYAVGTLFYEEHTDEDDLGQRIYFDNTGRKVLEETVGNKYGVLRTAYVYNDMGKLRCVVPPMASSPSDGGLCYYYKYDKRGRVCEKKIPDHGTERYVYDKKSRLVMTQDENQYNNHEWTFTQYDVFDRVVLGGCLSTTISRETLQSLFDSQSIVDEQWSAGGPVYGYSGTSYPSTLQVAANLIETANWYDNYGFLALFNQNYDCPASPLGDPVLYDERTKGMLTGSLEKANLDATGINMLHVYYYDSKGQLLCSVSDNHLSGRTNRFFKYNFNGQVSEEATVHYNAKQDSTIVQSRHTYDHTGRELQEYYKVNNGPEFISRAYEYNGIGDVFNTYLYSQDNGNTFSQKLKYHYNIRGWLTDMNDFSNIAYDLFALKLAYESPNATLSDEAYYDGNISQMCSNGRYAKPFGLGLSYDEYGRLFDFNYAESINLNQNTNAFREDYEYDDNGNLIALSRTHKEEQIDVLWYSYYEGTNRIQRISDYSNRQEGYPCVGETYLYDSNGNMTYDPSRYIDVTYNRFNQPLTINSAVTERVVYTYSTIGKKLRKAYSTLATPGSRVTDYCDEFLYEDNELVCIFTPFGRIVPMITANDTLWKICYSLTDHLGNVRVEFVAHGDGQAEQLQQTDYYPFGYIMRRNDYASTRPNHRLYGGKELQDEKVAGRSLKWYDFEARMYDPLIGRFLSTDPLAEKYYSLTPYGYCGDNPMNFIDPTGTSISEFDEEGNYIRTTHDNWWHNLWHGRTGRVVDTNGNTVQSFYFADPQKDVEDLKKGKLTQIHFIKEEEIENMLGKAGVFDEENKIKNRNNRYGFIIKEGKGGGKLDFAMKHGGIESEYSEPYKSLYLVDGVAHNPKNYGNFLFGAAGRALGLTKIELLLGAHYNSLFNSKDNGYKPQFDSTDDQYSIRLGVQHANNHNYKEKSYKVSVGPIQINNIY